MLATDAKKLWWMGIDMHSRMRRRVAVVATYAAFIEAVWIHPRCLYFVPFLIRRSSPRKRLPADPSSGLLSTGGQHRRTRSADKIGGQHRGGGRARVKAKAWTLYGR